jgi:hypothetical protein
MADQGKWFKLWCGARRDEKLAALSKEDFANWCLLGTYLKEHGNDGMVCLVKPAVALTRHMELGSYDELLEVLKRMPSCVVEEKHNEHVSPLRFITVSWSNWFKYQGDLSTPRVRQLRDKMKRSKRRGEENKKRGEKEVFIAPTIFEVTEFATAEKLPLDCQKFFNHYQSKGWMVGKSKMKDWKASARNAASDWACLKKENSPSWM